MFASDAARMFDMCALCAALRLACLSFKASHQVSPLGLRIVMVKMPIRIAYREGENADDDPVVVLQGTTT